MTIDPEVTHLGTDYDYSSIMHYRWNEFAIDKTKPTIRLRQTRLDTSLLGLGKRDQLSPVDIIEINKLYKCFSDGTYSLL
jgi:hypothetical protein